MDAAQQIGNHWGTADEFHPVTQTRFEREGPAPRKDLVMPHIIAEPCIGTKDTSCVEVCPVDCIHPTQDDPDFETAEQLLIDPVVSIVCGLCADECPVRASFPEEDLPGEWNKYVQLNLDYFSK